MEYTLVNRSSFKTPTLHRLIKFATRGFGCQIKQTLHVEVSDQYDFSPPFGPKFNTDKWGGETWDDKTIFIWISPKQKFPHVPESHYSAKTRYIDGQYIKNRQEMFLFIFAHEFFHVLQSNFKDPIVVSNFLPIDEEAQCDIAAMILLNKMRRKKK